MDKETCFKAEADILVETAYLQATYWKTEWWQMSVDRLHKIVMNYLERNQIKFVLEVEATTGETPLSGNYSGYSNSSSRRRNSGFLWGNCPGRN